MGGKERRREGGGEREGEGASYAMQQYTKILN